MSFDFFPNEQTATLLDAARKPSTQPEPGTFTNFLPGAGGYAMRSLAEVGRAIDLAGSVLPIAVDAATGGTARQDRYFREHDEVFNSAVDYWTPRPGEVGAAGQIAGQLAGGVLQAIISPALLVGTSQLSTAEDLVRQGVDAGAANVVGDIAGVGAAVGLKLPFLGQSLATRVLSGAGGNIAQGAAAAAASQAVLDAAGNPAQAAQYEPLDLRARMVDALLGAAFGGLAHVSAKLSPVDDAALLVANQARHLEETTLPGRPVAATDLTQHVAGMRQAIDQVLRGEPVTIDKTVQGMHVVPDAAMLRDRAQLADELVRAAHDTMTYETEIRPSALAQVHPFDSRFLDDERNIDPAAHAYTIKTVEAMAEAQQLIGERRFAALAEPLSADRPTDTWPAAAAARVEMVARKVVDFYDKHPNTSNLARVAPSEDSVHQLTNTTAAPAAPAVPDGAAALPPDLTAARAAAALHRLPDLVMPTGGLDAAGEPVVMRAADVIDQARAATAEAKATAPDLFKTAAACLLGAL